MTTQEKPRIFDAINAINRKDPSYKYDKKDVSGYMLLMWFSHAVDCSDILNEINNHLFDIPDELVYNYLYKAVPKGQRFMKYDKGTKDKKLLIKQQKIVQSLIDECQMSKREATMLLKRYLND